LYGLNPYHVRLLVDDPWNGGAGFQGDVGALTVDEVLMRLTDRKLLKAKTGAGLKTPPLAVAKDDGLAGRTEDGRVFKGRVRGKSVARQLMEEVKRDEKGG
jgi:hypothetical protein